MNCQLIMDIESSFIRQGHPLINLSSAIWFTLITKLKLFNLKYELILVIGF